MVGGINGGKPNAQHDDTEDDAEEIRVFRLERVVEGNYHVGGVQRRYGRKYIGVARIEGVEDA